MKKITYFDNKNITGAIFAHARKKHGMSQSELSAKMQVLGVNIDQQMISKIENNSRIVTDYELFCLCHILKINPSDIFEDFANKL